MLYIEPRGGLCNRMRSINSALYLSKKIDMPLTIIWVRSPGLSCPINELFELPDNIGNIVEVKRIKWISRIFDPTKKYKNRSSKFIGQPTIMENLGDMNYFNKLQEYGSIYIKSFSMFYQYKDFNIFQPVQKIKNVIENYTKNFNNTIGIHIRRQDNERSIAESKTEDFIAYMKKEIDNDPSTTYFLATDSIEEELALIDIFKDRIITHKKELRRSSKKGVQDALVDLMCLANTKKIYGSYWSSFSDVAAEINGIEKIIVKSNRSK